MIVIQPSYRVFTPPAPPVMYGGAGYFGGGANGGGITGEIDGIRFDTEASINPASALTIARQGVAGVNSPTRGYFAGGTDYPTLNNTYGTIDGIRFDTEAAISTSASMSVARTGAAGMNSTSRGYFCADGSNLSAEIDGIRFDTEASINPAATLSLGRNGVAGVNSTTNGYIGGGTSATSVYQSNGTFYTEIDGLQFGTETAINPSAGLATARAYLAGMNSSTRGYFGGGYTGYTYALTLYAEIDGIQFDTESTINPAAGLASARANLAGVNSAGRGYFGGGSSSGYPTAIDGIRFDTEAAISPGANLAAGRYNLAGVNSGSL